MAANTAADRAAETTAERAATMSRLIASAEAQTPATSTAEEVLSRAIAEQGWWDRLALPLQQSIASLLERSGSARSFLNGSWLGHPVHAAVTDLPVGAWATGLALDVADAVGSRHDLRPGADAAHVVGLGGALGAAVFGLADWSYTGGPARRVGLVHGLSNVAIVGIYGASVAARVQGHRKTGVALGATGFAALLFSTWLGGTLSYRYGVGVNRRAFQDQDEGEEDEGWQAVLDARAVSEGALRRAEVAGTPVLVTRYAGQIYAIGDTCTHMGCSLSDGKLQGDEVMCPCHNSHFRITDGQVVKGPATVAEPAYESRVRDGRILLRPRVTTLRRAA